MLYRSSVLPTMHTIAGGSSDSSRYIWYSDDPLGVVSCHADCFVPLPFTFATPGSYVWQARQAPEASGRIHGVGGDQRNVEVVAPQNHVLRTFLRPGRERLVKHERARVDALSQHHPRPFDELDIDRGNKVGLRAPWSDVRGHGLVLDEYLAHVQGGLHRSDQFLRGGKRVAQRGLAHYESEER